MTTTDTTSHPTASTTESVIQVEGLRKRYGKFVAVRGIDFTVRQGEIFGLIGLDGAGKTTTFHILAGVMEASEGTVQVVGLPPRDARLDIGYLTQQFSLYLDLSIDENLSYSAGLRKIPLDLLQQRRNKYLTLMGLERFSDRLAGQLSGGMKQKLALCCALVSQPQILLLDEPTTGVDPVSRREFWDVLATLANEGVTIVVATPYLDEAERCNRIALMYGGQIQQTGTLKQLRDDLGLERLEVRTENLQVLEAAEKILLSVDAESDPRIDVIHSEQTHNAIADVQSFGDRLDVLVPNVQKGEAQVRRLLNQNKIPLDTIETGEATLENVFVTRLRASGSDPPFIPFPRKGRGVRGEGRGNYASSVAISTSNLRKVFGNFQAVKGVNLDSLRGNLWITGGKWCGENNHN